MLAVTTRRSATAEIASVGGHYSIYDPSIYLFIYLFNLVDGWERCLSQYFNLSIQGHRFRYRSDARMQLTS